MTTLSLALLIAVVPSVKGTDNDSETGFCPSRWQHGERIEVLDWSADGKWIVSGSRDRTLSLWDAQTGEERHRWTGTTNYVAAAAFSPDGKHIAFHLGSTKLQCVEVATLREVWSVNVSFVSRIRFSPDGKWLGTSESDHAVHLRDAQTGKERHRFEESTYFAFSPDGKKLAIMPHKGDCALRAIDSGEVTREVTAVRGRLIACRSELTDLAFGLNGDLIITFVGPQIHHVEWVDLDEDKAIQMHEGEAPLRVHPRGRNVIANTHEGVTWFKPESGGQIGQLPVQASALAYSPDGNHVAVANDHRIEIWDLENVKRINGPPQPPLLGVGYLSERRMLIVRADSVELWDTESREVLHRYQPDEPTTAFYLIPNQEAFVLATEKKIQLWHARQFPQSPTHEWEWRGKPLTRIAVSHDGQTLAGIETERGLVVASLSVKKKPLASRQQLTFEVNNLSASMWGKELTFAPNGRDMAVSGEGFVIERVHRQKVPSGQFLVAITHIPSTSSTEEKPHPVRWSQDIQRSGGQSLAFSPDGDKLAVPDGRRIVIFDALTGKRWSILHGDWLTGSIETLAFSPTGRIIAGALPGPVGGVRLWDVQTGKVIHTFSDSRGHVDHFAFSPRSREIVAAWSDGTIRVYDAWPNQQTHRESTSLPLDEAWKALITEDITEVYRAMNSLASAGAKGVSTIRAGMVSARKNQQRIRAWIDQLDSPRFAVREKATRELIAQGSLALNALYATQDKGVTGETEQRINLILRAIKKQVVGTSRRGLIGEPLRTLRVVQVLERLGDFGTPDAKKLLEEIARSEPKSLAGREAKAILRAWGEQDGDD